MMSYYFVKRPLYGIAAGHVERFAPYKAAVLVAEGQIEPYDEKNRKHREAIGAPAQEASKVK